MIGQIALVRANGWLVAALLLATIGLCWNPAWWTIALFLFAVMTILLDWQRAIRRVTSALAENRRLRARIHEFGNLQGRFVGNVAHEIKTPLAVVLGETDLLAFRCGNPAAVRSIAASIAAEVRHLSDLVESFLQLAHPFVEGDASAHVPVFVGDIVIAAVARCRTLSTKLGVRVVTMLAEPDNGDPSAEVMGDPVLLEVLVENLVRHALRFSPPAAEVEVTTSADADSAAIVVRDRGLGIPIEQHQSVFDWFFEGPGRPAKTLGTGFGLAIAKRVADHHRGTIVLRDRRGGGCEFEVTLPRCWPEGESLGSSAAEHRGGPPVTPIA